MRRYFEFVLNHPRWVVACLILLSALSVASLSRAVLGSTLRDLFFGDAPEYQHYIDRTREFGNDEVFFIGVEETDPLASNHLDRLEAAVERIEADEDIEHVQSILSATRIAAGEVDDFGSPTLDTRSYADVARESPERRMDLLEALRTDPVNGGLVIADDGRSHVLIVEMTVDPDRNPEQRPDLVTDMLEIMVEEGFAREKLHLTGMPRMLIVMLEESYRTMTVIFPFTLVIMIGIVLSIFRRLAPVLVASSVSLLAVLWTMGFATELDRHHSIMSTLIPAVVMVVAVSDVIHLWSAYLEELRAGRTKRDAILESATDVGRACLWTSLTTFVGFVCLSLVPTPVFRLMGIVLGVGVAVALLLAMTLVPLVLSRLEEPETKPLEQTSSLDKLLRWMVDWCARVSMNHPKRVVVVFGLFMVWIGVGLGQFRIETRFSDRLAEDSEYRQDAAWFGEHYQGTQSLEVYIHAPEPEGLLTRERVAAVDEFESRIRDLPEVDGVFSYVMLLEQMLPAFCPHEPSHRLPPTDAAVFALVETASMSGGESLESMLDFERDSMRAGVRLNIEGIREIHDLGERIEEIGEEELGDLTVEATGILSLVGWWVDAILDGQKNGLLLSFSVITLMMVMALRSIRAGLLSMVPNVLPLLTVGAALGWTTEGVDSDALVIGMMAIGIGVDDTIHFMVRYRLEAARCESRSEAVRRTFDFAGRAIFITTLILSMGFLPFLLSDYLSLWYFGALLPLALIVALLADLLWVPALAQLGVFGLKTGSKAVANESGSG